VGLAQNWFNAGTILHRPYHMDFNLPGYIKYTANGTVTVNSLTCQQILAETKCVYLGNMATVTNTYNIITHHNNGLVTRYFPTSNTFDTIYNFNAVVGDQWSLTPKSYTNCAKSKVIVNAIGTKTIQGVTLKWLKVTINGFPFWSSSPNVYTDTILERIGSIGNDFLSGFNLCKWATDGAYGKWIRCYSDSQIINYKNNLDTNACDFYATPVSINESKINQGGISVYPNPVHDYLIVKSDYLNSQSTKVSYLTIFNSYGKLIITKKINPDGKMIINVGDYPKGIYFIKLTDEDLKTYTQKIIVE
jgi:hypothetical protein